MNLAVTVSVVVVCVLVVVGLIGFLIDKHAGKLDRQVPDVDEDVRRV